VDGILVGIYVEVGPGVIGVYVGGGVYVIAT